MIKLKANAKINLWLKVYKKKFMQKRHKIESLFSIVEDLYDEITISEIDNKIDIIECDELENKQIFVYLIELLRKNKIIDCFYKITIKKNIPFYSGLGGLSSCIAKIGNHFLANIESNIKEKIIKQICKKAGFDCFFFFREYKTAIVSSYGEIVTEYKIDKKIYKKDLIFSNIKCVTKDVFNFYNKNKLWKNNTFKNMLTPAIIGCYPEIKYEIKNDSFFSGSGSTMVKDNKIT